MSFKERNMIVPQMKEYDKIGEHWVPYLMWFHSGNIENSTVSTDKYGLRVTTGKNGVTPIEYEKYMSHSATGVGKAVLLGASTVFGVGASSDKYTIPSLLNKKMDINWFNLGGRAFNSTQELLLFQLHLPPVDEVVILSGVNNLTLAFLSGKTSAIYNSFYYQTVYEKAMSLAQGPNPYRGFVGTIKKAIVNKKLKSIVKHNEIQTSISDRYTQILNCTHRDLKLLKALGNSLGFKVKYCLQPMASWMCKDFAKEELQLFEILDKLGRDWKVLSNYLNEMHEKYSKDLSEICGSLKIPFQDLNCRQELLAKDWLFVDRVHLTDKGNELIADIIGDF